MEWFQDLKAARLLLKISQMDRSFSNYVGTNFIFSLVRMWSPFPQLHLMWLSGSRSDL